MSIYVVVLLVVITAVLAGGIVLLLTRSANQRTRTVENAERAAQEARANQRLAEVESSVKERLLEAKEEAVKIRTAAAQEARGTRAQFQVYDRRLPQAEGKLGRRADELENGGPGS